MTAPTVCVVGSLMYDLCLTVERRPLPGETVVGHSLLSGPGGKGFNQAVAAARAGAGTELVGRVGEDEHGRAFLAALAEHGIGLDQVRTTTQRPTGLGVPMVEVGDGQNSIIVLPGANAFLSPDDIAAARGAIESGRALLLQLETPAESSAAAARIARESGAVVVFNPAPFSSEALDLLHLVDVLVVNEVEAACLSNGRSPDRLSLAQGVHDASRVPAVVVTFGGEGAAVVGSDGRAWLRPAHPVNCVDSVGAGDAFCGYLARHLAAGAQLDAAVSYAMAAGALTVTRRGSSVAIPSWGEVEAFRAAAEGGAALIKEGSATAGLESVAVE
jgi:ribokinase